MSLLDCEKCWENPCSCGHEYKDWDTKRLVEFVKVLQEELARRPDPLPFRREYQGVWQPMTATYRRRGEEGEWRVVVIQAGVVTLSGPGPCRGRKVVTIERFHSEWEPAQPLKVIFDFFGGLAPQEKTMDRAAKNIAFALAVVAVRFASERCGDVEHNCGASFSCQKPRYVLEGAGLWKPDRPR